MFILCPTSVFGTKHVQFPVGQPHTHTGYKMSISPSPFSTPTKLLQKAEGSLAHYDVSIPMVTHNAGEVEPTI